MLLRARMSLLMVVAATSLAVAQSRPTGALRPIDYRELVPFDKAIHTATLPNGLKYFVRQNDRPAKRVSLRLGVKAGSLNEADDQLGLAHLIEHMAFNGSAHFKPGELVKYFETMGARLGPHVNAYTSFDETVYMFDVPSDQPEIVEKALTALSDFAGGLSLTQQEVDKERGVVIEEWRGGLGAGSRIRDKQFPILFYHSRYADRLPIGKPDIIRNAPVARLRAFYDTWYRPDRMAVIAVGDIDVSRIEQSIRTAFTPIRARATAARPPDQTVPLHKELLVAVTTDPEVTRSTVTIERKRPRESELHVGDYRRQLIERMVERMMDARLGDLARKADAKFLGAGVNFGNLNGTVSTFAMAAGVQDGRLEDGLTALATEAQRAKEYGFTASEMDRAKQSIAAFYERAYNERDKTESPSFAAEYLRHFFVGEPTSGIAYEYELVKQLLPTITTNDASALIKAILNDDSRVVLAVSPQKPGIKIPSEADLQAALKSGTAASVDAWSDNGTTREIMDKVPDPGTVTSKRTIDALGVTVLRFSNGVEAWLKPTDFKNDQVLFTLNALGGASLAAPADYPEATLSPAYIELSGAGGLRPGDIARSLTGKLVSANSYVSLSTHGISGSAAPAQLETALQLFHQRFVAPGDDPDAFGLLKRQLDAMVANRGRAPAQVFGEKVSQVNTSNHYTSTPITTERIAALDRDKMVAFYHQLFANAADFSFFMVGAFKVDDAIPLLARYVGSLPSTGERTLKYKDVNLRFPETTQRVKVEQGREPRGQTVISFFADPAPDPVEQENINAATVVLDVALRDILREDLGQTYGVSVGLSQPLPQRGEGHIQIRFGAAPENIESMTARVMTEIKRLQQEGPSVDLTNRAKEAARRSYELALKQNNYWLARLQSAVTMGSNAEEILKRGARIDAVTPQTLQDVFKKYFPAERSTVVTLMPAATQG
jgi:zinc protease